MPTAFRDTATLPDRSGRYRTSLILASRLYGDWSESAIADYIRRAPRPCKAVTLTDSEYERLEADSALRRGYVDAPGDIDSDFEPCAWESF